MAIDGVRISVSGIAAIGTARAQGRGPGGFTVATGAPSTLAAAPDVSALDGLLALQESQSDAVSEREARRHGRDTLAELKRLQLALLTPAGADDAELARLAALAQAMPVTADPGLRDVLQAIGLRARIELTKPRLPLPPSLRPARQPG